MATSRPRRPRQDQRRAGSRPGDSAVEVLLRGSDRRISTAVISSARVDLMPDQVKARAGDPSVQGALVAASITWSKEAADVLAEAV